MDPIPQVCSSSSATGGSLLGWGHKQSYLAGNLRYSLFQYNRGAEVFAEYVENKVIHPDIIKEIAKNSKEYKELFDSFDELLKIILKP